MAGTALRSPGLACALCSTRRRAGGWDWRPGTGVRVQRRCLGQGRIGPGVLCGYGVAERYWRLPRIEHPAVLRQPLRFWRHAFAQSYHIRAADWCGVQVLGRSGRSSRRNGQARPQIWRSHTVTGHRYQGLIVRVAAGLMASTALLAKMPVACAQSQQPGFQNATPQPGQPLTVRLPPSDDGAGDNATALAKKLQNPIGDLYSFPFQNNTNFNSGPHKGTQDILNIQPVIPIHLNEDWNVITRTILPLIWQPSLQPAQTVPFGIGPTTFSAFLRRASRSTAGCGASVRSCRYRRSATRRWLQCLGRRPDGVFVYIGALGHRRAREQRLVVRRHAGARRHALQHIPDSAS